ncbi:unnamed protein product [Prunus armeniaca]
MRMASGSEPRMGRNKPPTMPGPRISSNSSLPLERYVAEKYIKYPYTKMRNRFPSTLRVHGKNPYVSSHAPSASADKDPLRSLRARWGAVELWGPTWTPSEITATSCGED